MYISVKKIKRIAAVSVALSVLISSNSFLEAASSDVSETINNKSEYLNKLYKQKLSAKSNRAEKNNEISNKNSCTVENNILKKVVPVSEITSVEKNNSGKFADNEIKGSTSEVKLSSDKAGAVSKAAAEVTKVDLKKCIEIAQSKNPQILEAQYALDSQKYKINQARASLKPQVGFNGQTSWTDSETTQRGKTSSSRSGSRSAGLSYSQVVYDGGKLQDNVNVADKNAEIAELNYTKTRLDVFLTVAQNFYNVITTMKLEKVAEDTLKSSVMHQELAEANFNVGISPKTDLIRSQANTYEKKLSFITAQNNTKKADLSLLISMGLMGNEALSLSEDLKFDTFDVNLEKSIAAAIADRTEVKAQQDAIDTLKIQLHQAEIEKTPQFSVGANAGASADNGSSDRKSFSLTGTFTVPILNGYSTENKIAEIKEKIKAEEQKLANLLLNIRYEITQAYLNLTEAFEKIEVSKKNVESSELSKTLTTEQYKVGLATMIDLLDSELLYANSMTNLIQSQGNYLTAKCKFRRSIGDMEFYK